MAQQGDGIPRDDRSPSLEPRCAAGEAKRAPLATDAQTSGVPRGDIRLTAGPRLTQDNSDHGVVAANRCRSAPTGAQPRGSCFWSHVGVLRNSYRTTCGAKD